METREKDGKIFCPLKNEWHIATPEEKVRQRYVCALANEYGYAPEQMAQEWRVTGSHRATGSARADIVVWKSAADKAEDRPALLVVECKAENVRIHEEDYYQGLHYAAWMGADFFVTTNERETKFFTVDKEHAPRVLNEVVAIPTLAEVGDARKLEELKNKTKRFTREEFTRTLRACHDIIRNNDKLSPEAAFDEISKLLFMKIRQERAEQRIGKVFTEAEYMAQRDNYELNVRPSLKGTPKDVPYMQSLFGTTKEAFRDDRLFEESDTINIRENSFKQILKKLEDFTLSDTQDDVKGIAFEQFLGTTFRGELGQFFTPRTVVDFMTGILDPREGEIICDPTCGSGGFLIKAFEYVRDQIEADIRERKEARRGELEGSGFDALPEKSQQAIAAKVEAMQAELNAELAERVSNLSGHCIYGTDANPRMARTSKMNMIMHGDGHGGVHHHDGLLNVNGIFEGRFDVILTNPPFGQSVDRRQLITEADRFTDEAAIKEYLERYGEGYRDALGQVNDHLGRPLLSLYDLGSVSALTEVLFMERCLRLLKPGGRMGMVLPEGVLNNKQLSAVRRWFEGRAKILLICSLPQDVFMAAGASVKPSLVFLRRFTVDEEQEYARCQRDALAEATESHRTELDVLNARLAEATAAIAELPGQIDAAKGSAKAELKRQLKDAKAEQRSARLALDELNRRVAEEAKPIVKRLFSYDAPIVEVQDAGITRTGEASPGNQLPDVLKEYTAYRKEHGVWP